MVVGKKSASVYNISVDEKSSGDRKSLTGVNPRSAQAKSNFQKYNLYKQTKIYLWLQDKWPCSATQPILMCGCDLWTSNKLIQKKIET